MRVLFLTGRETSYPRNDVLLRAFRRFADVEVVSPTRRKSTLRRSLWLPLKAAAKLRSGEFDLVFVGFYGHLLMLPVSRLAKAPILFDVFISTFDTLTMDRQRFSAGSLAARLAFRLDKAACRRADHLLVDTPQHRDYFARTFGIPGDEITPLPVGCSEDLFHPMRIREENKVLYYSSYQPLHGTETVVRAAQGLQDLDVSFRLIGSGQAFPAAKALAEGMELKNIRFQEAVPLESLPPEIGSAAICLGGHFGVSEKAGRVVPGKIYQMLAMQRPVIAADTPANRSLLTHGESAFLVPPGDPAALASAIRELLDHPETRQRIARGGRERYAQAGSEGVITEGLKNLAMRICGK